MKTVLIGATTALLALASGVSAQDAPPAATPTTETTTQTTVPTANGNGADVARTTATTTTTTPLADGSAKVDTRVSTAQTVTAPSGVTNTVTRTIDELGAKATEVDHAKAAAAVGASAHTGHAAKPTKKPK